MLNQFYEEWNAALDQEHVESTDFDKNKQIVRQKSTFEFRGCEIQIHRKRLRNGDFVAELFVPKTGKIINCKAYASKASCAAAILMALIPGNEKEEVRTKRAAAKASEQIKEIMADRLKRLDSKITMLENDRAWFSSFFNHNLQIGKYRNDNMVVDVLCEFYGEIAGDPEKLKDLNEYERPHHIDRMYEMACTALARVRELQNGEMIIPKVTVEYLFRNDPPANIRFPQGVLFVRSIYKRMDALIHHPTKLAYVIHTLRAYYEMRTGRTPEQVLKAIEERKARAKERSLRRAEGYTEDGKFSIFNRRLTAPTVDETVQKEAVLEKTEQSNPDGLAPDKPKAKQSKPKAKPQPKEHEPITNGMVSIGDVLGSALGDMDFGHGDEELVSPDITVQEPSEN